jgi:hypothetical protein
VEIWYAHDDRHREDGPAIIKYRKDGSIQVEGWYLGGELLNKFDFWRKTPLSHEELTKIIRSASDQTIIAAISKNPNYFAPDDILSDWY